MLASIRAFFAERDVLEVETPVLGTAFGTDPAIEPLESRFQGPGFSDGLQMFLQSSPEFFMKRLLAAGSGPIYQIGKAFRNGEAGRRHNPEFSLLEWYRPGFGLAELMGEVSDLVCAVVMDPPSQVHRVSYAELFAEFLDFDPFAADAQALRERAIANNLPGAEALDLDREGWLELLMSTFIEPQLGQGELTFVTDYPASQASLARLNRHDPRTAARFELYWKGLELANGFEELADAEEQSERFEQENCRRYSAGQRPMPVDDALLSALESGLPPCSGVALGLDRLLMCDLGLDDIEAVMSFPLSRL